MASRMARRQQRSVKTDETAPGQTRAVWTGDPSRAAGLPRAEKATVVGEEAGDVVRQRAQRGQGRRHVQGGLGTGALELTLFGKVEIDAKIRAMAAGWTRSTWRLR